MNNTAFQIYGTKRSGVFQSTWDTTLTEVSTVELASTATGTNWSGSSYALGYTHTPGSTVSLTSAILATERVNYTLVATISNYVAGSVTINYGGTSNAGISSTTTLNLLASTTGQLTIIPTSDFDGRIAITLKQSSTPSNQIKLPLISTGTYNFWVDWGDGSVDNITNWNQAESIHTYSTTGIYKLRIVGVINGWKSSSGNLGVNTDRKKIKTISSWGRLKITEIQAFEGCSNLTLDTIDDILDLSETTTLQNTFKNCTAITTIGRINEWNTSGITSLSSCFEGCTNFNSPLSNWNTTNVTTMGIMFKSCTNFNQNIGAWNVANCLDFSEMFNLCTNFNNGGNTSINNWVFKTSGNINMNGMFSLCTNFNQPLNNWNTTRVVNMGEMFLGASSFNQNIGAWDVSNWTTSGSMFQSATAFNNGGSSDINNWNLNTTPGVNLSFGGMFFGASSFNQPLNNWNTTRVTNMNNMFRSATNFNNGLASGVAGTLAWNTTNLTNMGFMFNVASAFNCNIGAWDVSSVTEFADMFLSANNFNNGGSSDINNWTLKPTGTVNMSGMLRSAAFNQPIGNWNMSRVTSISSILQGATLFNQNLNSWNLSTCTNMNSAFASTSFNNGNASGVGNTLTMTLNTTTPFIATSTFSNTAFNCDVNSLDFTQCTNMAGMFSGCTNFNNGLTAGTPGVLTINTGNVTNMSSMFSGCTSFNQDVGLLNVSKVTGFILMFRDALVYNNGADANPINNWTLNTTVGANINMTQMFRNASGTMVFNRALNNWNTSEVTNMSDMFANYGTSKLFNQPLNNWNTAKVTNMSTMFQGNTAFNQDISTWSTGAVTNMNSMFNGATAFQQNLGSWNIANVTNFTSFMAGKTPTTFASTYLDNIYNGWSSQIPKTPITISFGTAKYSAASKAGKDILIGSPYNWSITDGLLNVTATTSASGVIRITTNIAHGLTTGTSVFVYGVGGTTNANGTWTVTVMSTTVLELQGSVYNAIYTSGGNVILG